MVFLREDNCLVLDSLYVSINSIMWIYRFLIYWISLLREDKEDQIYDILLNGAILLLIYSSRYCLVTECSFRTCIPWLIFCNAIVSRSISRYVSLPLSSILKLGLVPRYTLLISSVSFRHAGIFEEDILCSTIDNLSYNTLEEFMRVCSSMSSHRRL